jgi:hypothetical protein
MRPLLLALLVFAGGLFAGCVAPEPSTSPSATPPPATAAGGDRTISGVITAIDFDPMAYDGDGVLTVETDEGAEVRVFIPARMHLCEATFEALDGLGVGHRITVRGEASEPGAIRPCTSAEHYVRRL